MSDSYSVVQPLIDPGWPGVALVGVSQPTMQQWLATAQTAYAQLQSGQKVATASYTQGDGAKSVTYTQAQSGALMNWIIQLQRALGNTIHGRRPLRFWFR